MILLAALLATVFGLALHGAFFYAVNVSSAWSQQELEAIIPRDTQGQLSLREDKGIAPYHAEGAIIPGEGDEKLVNPGLEDLETIECTPMASHVMFFVRIPKCASTSFVTLLQKLSQRSAFEVFFHPSGAFDWDTAYKTKVARTVESKAASPGRGFVYARHFYYVDFSSFGLSDYTYTTIIRDPVSRYVSSYLYYHFSSKQHIQDILDPRHRKESLSACLKLEHEGCKKNLMMQYFCGHDSLCKRGSQEALLRAKQNLRTKFALVGIMEEMRLSMAVFKALLPSYFHDVNLDALGSILPEMNKNENSLEVSPELQQEIAAANWVDVELYSYAKQLLHAKASACKLL